MKYINDIFFTIILIIIMTNIVKNIVNLVTKRELKQHGKLRQPGDDDYDVADEEVNLLSVVSEGAIKSETKEVPKVYDHNNKDRQINTCMMMGCFVVILVILLIQFVGFIYGAYILSGQAEILLPPINRIIGQTEKSMPDIVRIIRATNNSLPEIQNIVTQTNKRLPTLNHIINAVDSIGDHSAAINRIVSATDQLLPDIIQIFNYVPKLDEFLSGLNSTKVMPQIKNLIDEIPDLINIIQFMTESIPELRMLLKIFKPKME